MGDLNRLRHRCEKDLLSNRIFSGVRPVELFTVRPSTWRYRLTKKGASNPAVRAPVRAILCTLILLALAKVKNGERHMVMTKAGARMDGLIRLKSRPSGVTNLATSISSGRSIHCSYIAARWAHWHRYIEDQRFLRQQYPCIRGISRPATGLRELCRYCVFTMRVLRYSDTAVDDRLY